MIKSFRGLLADGEQDTIRLATNDGLTGYKIKKFELLGNLPGASGQQSIVKLFTREQTAVDGTVDFDDSTLLAAGYYAALISSAEATVLDVVFDNVTFNQDIFITHYEDAGSIACNYYLELEQVKLDLNEATVATLKDMRGSA
jgi:hypothetical protein